MSCDDVVEAESMSDAYERALARRSELEAELAEIDTFIKVHNRFVEVREQPTHRIRMRADPPSQRIRERVRGSHYPEPDDVRLRPVAIADAVEAILRKEGKPMRRGQLVQVLEDDLGISLPSSDKPRYLGTILWRQGERFENIEGRGYWLTGLEETREHEQLNVDNADAKSQ